MSKKDFLNILGGLVYLGLGIVLIAAVSNLLDRASVYGLIIPIVLLVSGLLLLLNPQPRTVRIVSGGMTGVGAIALLVRYTALSSTLIHTILGIIFITLGVTILSRSHYARRQHADTPSVK